MSSAKKRNRGLEVLEQNFLLCRLYQRDSLDDIFEARDLTPDSSKEEILGKKAKYGPLFWAFNLEMTVEPMHIGLVMDEANQYLLARPGIHLIKSMFCRGCGQVDIGAARKIQHGNRNVVLVEEGHVGLAWCDGQPVLLPDGYHAWTHETMHFERQMPLDLEVVQLGPYTLVTVNDGFVGITQDNGKVTILEGGRPHVLTHAAWKFEYMLPLHTQTDEFFSDLATSADNIQMRVRASVVWKVADPKLVRTNLTVARNLREWLKTKSASKVMERLRKNVIQQVMACISKFTAMVCYCDTFHASAAFAADQQGVRGRSRSATSTDNPFFDSAKLSKTLDLANAITRQYGVQVVAIDVVEATPLDSKLRDVLTVGAQAAADAMQLARVKQGEADAKLVVERSKAESLVAAAKGKAEAMLIEAVGESDAMIVEAEGHIEAAKKLGSDPLTLLLERLRISNEILGGGEKLFTTQHKDSGKDPRYVFEINCEAAKKKEKKEKKSLVHKVSPAQAAMASSLNMILTERGASNRCVFAETSKLRAGGTVKLTLKSHPGQGIGKKYLEERRAGPWRYIESGCGPTDVAVSVKYEDGAFIKLANDDLVFDVAFWNMSVGTAVNFVGGTNAKAKTKLNGRGREWVINGDGTIGAKHFPHLVLGIQNPE